ncbi:MAG TPA: hypothetical protein VGN12_16935 [Pirellulales bacterium]|jgi:hypothetical protein
MLDNTMRQALIDCIEWTLHKADGIPDAIDTSTLAKVLKLLKRQP